MPGSRPSSTQRRIHSSTRSSRRQFMPTRSQTSLLIPPSLPCLARGGQLGPSARSARMIHVLAIITAQPGQREAVLEHFRANMPAVRAEEGCIEYVPVIDAEDAGPAQAAFGPNTFCVVEKWASMEALRAHAAAPHMADYGAKVRPMVASRMIHILRPAA